MGCWNATCGLTGLPIREGDPVIALFIQDEAFGRIEGSRRELTPSYVFQSFTPASFIVRGEYDDYGSVDLDDANKAKIMLTAEEARRYGKDVLVEKEGEEPRYGFTFGKLDKTFDIEEGHRQDDLPFALWMAHAPIFDKLVNEVTDEYYDRKTQKFGTRTIRENTQRALAEALEKHQSTERMFSFDSPWKESSTLQGAAFRYVEEVMRDAKDEKFVVGGKVIERPADPEITPEIVAMVTGAWADLVALYGIMSSLRLTMWPTGACGSQDGDLNSHKVRWSAMSDYISAREAKEREWNAEYGDEEDEDEDGAAASA